MKTPPLEHVVGCLTSAIPYAVLVWVLLRVWVSPLNVDGGAWVPLVVGLMMLEFLVLHSGMFMGGLAAGTDSVWMRQFIFTGLFLFYFMFALFFAVAVDAWEILGVYAWLMLGRFATVVVSAREGRRQLVDRASVGIVVYLVAVFGTLFLPLPELGLTPEVLDQVYPERGGGEWERKPQIAIAAGIFYFSVLFLYELKRAWTAPKQAPGAHPPNREDTTGGLSPSGLEPVRPVTDARNRDNDP